MAANDFEQEAHDAILAFCRSKEGQRRAGGIIGMRVTYGDERHVVIDLERTERKPGGKAWETQPITHASGATWLECLVQLKNKGLIQ